MQQEQGAEASNNRSVVKDKIMQSVFGMLKKQGKNSVDGLLQFLKDRKLLDDSTEKIAKQALSGVEDPKNIDYGKFAEMCEAVAKEKGLDVTSISKKAAASLFRKIRNSISTSAPAGSSVTATSTEPGANLETRALTVGAVGSTNAAKELSDVRSGADEHHESEDDFSYSSDDTTDHHSDAGGSHHSDTGHDHHSETGDDHHDDTAEHHDDASEHHDDASEHHDDPSDHHDDTADHHDDTPEHQR